MSNVFVGFMIFYLHACTHTKEDEDEAIIKSRRAEETDNVDTDEGRYRRGIQRFINEHDISGKKQCLKK